MDSRVQIDKGGRLVVPVELRRALKIKSGDELLIRLEKNSLRLIPIQQAVSLAQQSVKRYAPKGVSQVDELIEERKEEAGSD